MAAAHVRSRLLRWYRASRRNLPWRRTRDPYAIWISETMLQQTRVEAVIPYYERFLERFPDVRALATADLDDVLGVWAGLGYYSRARNLRTAAQALVERHGARLPDDPDALRALPGVGRYTAGAVASIAFDRPEPVVDGNVARVLARLLDVRENLRSAAGARRLWEEAARLVRGRCPGDLNQALMELGARVCTPRSPRCGDCPLAGACRARRAGDPEAIPGTAPKAAVPEVDAVAGWVTRRGRVLAVRRPPRGLMGGLWDLPGGELARAERPSAGLRRTLRERVGLSVEGARKAGSVQHVFSHRRLALHLYHCGPPRGRVRLHDLDAHRWVTPAELCALPQATLTRKAVDLLLGAEGARPAPGRA